MKRQERLDWLMDKAESGAILSPGDDAFAREYIRATGAKHVVRLVGAFDCPQLARDLNALRGLRKVRVKSGWGGWRYAYYLEAASRPRAPITSA